MAWIFGAALFNLPILGACNQPQREPAPSSLSAPEGERDRASVTAPQRASASPAPETMPGVESVCARYSSTQVPATDLALDAERARFKGCDAEALYYGLNAPVDYERARKCAFDGEPTHGGPGIANPEILMMIYANGRGVPVNLGLALRFACSLGGSPSELDARVARLWAARNEPQSLEGFDQCDDATSGPMTGYCADLQVRIAENGRKFRLQSATAGLPASELRALQSRAKLFFDVRSRKEVDQSGSQRASFAVAERSQLEDQFLHALGQLKDPEFVPEAADAKSVAAELASVLSSIANCKDLRDAEQGMPGLVTRAGIKETQRRWLEYRDAFVALALKLRPATRAEAWQAFLGRTRLAQLKELAAGC